MDDESQRDEMNAAIRAQRERGAVPRSMLPPEDEPLQQSPPASEMPPDGPPPDEPPPKRGLFSRLLGR